MIRSANIRQQRESVPAVIDRQKPCAAVRVDGGLTGCGFGRFFIRVLNRLLGRFPTGFLSRVFSSAFIAVIMMISGCSTYDAEKYVYRESQNDSVLSIEKTAWNEAIYNTQDYGFLPRFYTLASTYSSPHSTLVIYSTEFQSIYLHNVTLVSAQGTYTDVIEFDSTVKLDRFHDKREQHFGSVSLFDRDNTDLPNYWEEGDISVIIRFNTSDNEKSEVIAKFRLWKGREFAWPT